MESEGRASASSCPDSIAPSASLHPKLLARTVRTKAMPSLSHPIERPALAPQGVARQPADAPPPPGCCASPRSDVARKLRTRTPASPISSMGTFYEALCCQAPLSGDTPLTAAE